MTKRWIALVLVLAMLVLPACGNKKSDSVADQFQKKVASLEKQDNLYAKMTMTAQKTVGTYSYEESFEIKANLVGKTGKAPLAEISTKETIDDVSFKYVELYEDGKAYMEIDRQTYLCEESFEDFMASQYSYVLLNPDHYETVTYDKEAATYTFQNPTAPEDCIATEIIQLQSAEGTATVDEQGKLSAMTYTAQYIQGPVTVDVIYEVTYGTSNLTAEDVDPETDTIETTDLSIPYLMTRSREAMALQAPVSGNWHHVIMSQLVGAYYYVYSQYDSVDGENPMAQVTTNLQVEDAYDQVSMELVTTYKDGKTTGTMDGEEMETEQVSFAVFQEENWAQLQGAFMDVEILTNMTLTPVSDYWLVEYELTEEGAEEIQEYVSEVFLGNSKTLGAYVDELKPGTMEGWISVDMDTLLPASVGFNVEMTQVAQGYDCLLTVEVVCNMEFGDPDAYETIMEEPMPEVEPENKPTPLLYEVTDDNGGKMYLFGTIHVGDDATGFLPEYVTNALKESDYLGLEMNADTLEDRLDEDEALLDSYREGMIYMDGTLTADILDEETAASLKQLIRAMGKQPNMEYYLPAALSSYLSYLALDAANGLSQSKSVEDRLTKIAKDNEIPIIEIEDIHEHLKLYGRYSEQTQKFIMEDSLEIYRSAVQEDVLELYTAWCKGDEAELTDMIRDDGTAEEDLTEEELAALEEYNQLLSVERDGIMLEKAKEYIASGDTVFFAVGCAHLLSETGLVDGLREAGYTVTLISQ